MTVDERLAEVAEKVENFDDYAPDMSVLDDAEWLIAELRRTRAAVREALVHIDCHPWRATEQLERMLDGEQQGE